MSSQLLGHGHSGMMSWQKKASPCMKTPTNQAIIKVGPRGETIGYPFSFLPLKSVNPVADLRFDKGGFKSKRRMRGRLTTATFLLIPVSTAHFLIEAEELLKSYWKCVRSVSAG